MTRADGKAANVGYGEPHEVEQARPLGEAQHHPIDDALCFLPSCHVRWRKHLVKLLSKVGNG